MKKKLIFLTLIGTYLIFTLSAPISLAISSEIALDIAEKDIDKPINPSESKDISIKVKYRLDISGLIKRFYLNRRIGRVIAFGFLKGYFFKLLSNPMANLSITTKNPEWCQVDLSEDYVVLDYNSEFQEATIIMNITLDKNAPALQKEYITITAIYPGEGSVIDTTNSTNISFMPAYISNITSVAKSNYTITPNKENIISINVTNNGNGKSMVNLSGFEKENWNITPDQDNIIEVGETKEIMIRVTPPKKFDNESISITLEPISTVENVDDSYRQGNNVELSITFFNDGSLKDEDDNDIDITSAIIIAFIIIIILIIIYLIFRKKE